MAVAPRESQITREDVYNWLQEYQGQRRPTKALRAFLATKINNSGVSDQYVDTRAFENIKEHRMHVADMILLDLESYV